MNTEHNQDSTSKNNLGKTNDWGESKMAAAAKPANMAFRVSAESTEKFLSKKVNAELMLQRFQRLKKSALLSGKSESDEEIIFFTKKIEKFKKAAGNKDYRLLS